MERDVNISELLNRDIEEYNRFSSMLSKSVHDINNPLAVFIGQVSIIELLQQRGKLDLEKMEQIVDKFKTSSETLKERIGYLRNYYKVLIDDPMFSKLNNAIASACYIFENEAYQAGIDITVKHLNDIEVILPTSQVHIITKHLIQNAMESLTRNNKDGGGNISVQCTRTNDGHVEVIVQDDGPGLICPLELAVELGYTTKIEKTGGTGLAIIKKILDLHKIELNYSSKLGACFSFKIPIKLED